MIIKKSYIILFILMFPLSGCITVPERKLSGSINLNHDYEIQIASNFSANIKWWNLYNDEELSAILARAFIHNPNINQIRARLEQANAAVKQSRAALLPRMDISANHNEYRGDNILKSGFTLNGAASFEIDLWGGNKAKANASSFIAAASYADIAAAKITLSAKIVENWLEILSLQEQENIVKKQIDVNQTVLSLQEKRFEMGSSSALDILQQEERLAQSESLLPDILSKQEQAANNISLLIGNMPYNKLEISDKFFPKPLPIPKAGLPSDLLSNRPDIIAAFLRLKSSDWAIKEAWANRLPRFTLSPTYSTSGATLNALFNTWIVNLATNISSPIFDGGSRKAEQLRREALSDEKYHAYREVVLSAVNEVENLLTSNMYQDKKLVALEKQMLASKNTLEQAQTSYTNGKSSYINVLNSLNNTQFLEQQITSEKLKQAQMRVGLYRALGGQNWATENE